MNMWACAYPEKIGGKESGMCSGMEPPVDFNVERGEEKVLARKEAQIF